ncbi:MAG: ABC transporter ATP-binding protein/permease [Ruminococcaceae bacterium]|nr:ABC transporter ATP-binding protein/permease [Oscillospiraceae bacterium]
MLTLKNIIKTYKTGDEKVDALKGVNISFRKNEFVAILGHSGCGKTTLLNIIGGLDKYTSGDLIIDSKSTKNFSDHDWDTYRNHRVGFVFQSYNLIEHQSVLANVELALTLSGVSRKERRERAKNALIKVGLGDQLNKKPNQMSGGQMQRVAIARALVNNPEILLADEPTGALDSATSVQIMELIKEIAKDRLVIMVTHNPELAESYATRTVHLLDGNIVSDSDPFNEEQEIKSDEKKKKKSKKDKKVSMSFFTALSLSFNNLLTKKARTFLTAFAGSIGIIGIALILAISNGIDAYISSVEEDTLSSYPIEIQESTMSMGDMLSNMSSENTGKTPHDMDKIYSNNIMGELLNVMTSSLSQNNLTAFKEFLDGGKSGIEELTSGVQYKYSTTLNVYKADTSNSVTQVNPNKIMETLGFMPTSNPAMSMGMPSSQMSSTDVWQELLDNEELLKKQYDIIKGRMPEKYNEVVIIADKNNEINDFTIYSLGLKDASVLPQLMEDIKNGKEVDTEQTSYTYDELLGLEFKLLLNTDYYEKQGDIWVDKSKDNDYLRQKLKDSETIKVVGILRPSDEAVSSTMREGIGYTASLMEHLVNEVNKSEIVKAQKDNEEIDIFTGNRFPTEEDKKLNEQPITMDTINAYLETLPEKEKAEYKGAIQQMQMMGMPEEQIIEMFKKAKEQNSTDATYSGNLAALGVADLSKPSSILIYAKDFASKEEINELIADYNESVVEEDEIEYTDYIGLLMSSVTTIINAISYVLIAFVSISLVVSSIMIGIITYISVLERTKEIGILRAIGASKKDISRVFNAETFIIGLTAGALGIGLTLLMSIPINAIIYHFTTIANVAALPPVAGIALVIISMVLTMISGFIPAKIAAKKDPVVALRSE